MFDVSLLLTCNDAIITVRRGSICNVQNVEAGCMQRSFMISFALLMPGNAPVVVKLSIQLLLPIEPGIRG
jgi:hypothetical protein